MRVLRGVALGLVAGVLVTVAALSALSIRAPAAETCQATPVAEWPRAASAVVRRIEARAAQDGFLSSVHPMSPTVPAAGGGAVWTAVFESRRPGERPIYVPVAVELDGHGEMVEVR